MKLLSKILFLILIVISMSSAVFAEEILILFDASVSMNEDFYGSPKYVVAIREAKKFLSTLDNNRSIGLRTIGIKVDEQVLNYVMNPASMCKATQLDVPIRKGNNQYINTALDSILPLGTTPLEYSLRTAINSDFSYGSDLKHIVLITDGAESCDADPCRFIRQVMQKRKDIRIDVIAISVNNNDFLQLKCLTDATSGIITNIKNPQELPKAYSEILAQPSINNTASNYSRPSVNNTATSYSQPSVNNVTPAYVQSEKQTKAILYKTIYFDTYD